MIVLTWHESVCPIFGQRFDLIGLKDGESGNARKCGSLVSNRPSRFVAMAFINGHYMSHCAGALQSAISRLEKEIDKRSIGLFGDDTVTFRSQEEAIAQHLAAYEAKAVKKRKARLASDLRKKNRGLQAAVARLTTT